MLKPTDHSAIVKLLDHPHASVTWIVRPILKDGKLDIERVARIVAVHPRDGAGRLRIGITDWWRLVDHPVYGKGYPSHYVASASGFGYDKITACLDGMTIAGFEVGDHCNGRGVPTPRELVNREGLHVFGADFPL
jgi:hypothetical protein